MRTAKRLTKKFKHCILYGDAHYPFQDPEALRVVEAIIGDVRPDLLVDMGDLLDCYTISRYSKDPARKHDLQDEIDMGIAHLRRFAALAPRARRVLLDSNHFDRLGKTIAGMSNEAREIARLRAFQETVTWSRLLELGSDWEWLPQNQQAKTRLVPLLLLKHGSQIRQGSAMSARAEYLRYCRSGASGHSHRLGQYFHTDLDSPHVWLETGCTCDVNPEYLVDGYADWQQGVTVIAYTDDGDRFHVEQSVIHRGRAIYRDQLYVA